jgi:hypothetical protein
MAIPGDAGATGPGSRFELISAKSANVQGASNRLDWSLTPIIP